MAQRKDEDKSPPRDLRLPGRELTAPEADARGAMADWLGAAMHAQPAGLDGLRMESDDPGTRRAAVARFKGRPGAKGCAQARVAVRRELRQYGGEVPAFVSSTPATAELEREAA